MDARIVYNFMEAVKHGFGLAATTNGINGFITLTRKLVGEHYPKFFDTPLGKAIEPIAVCGILNVLASSINLPQARVVEKATSLALSGTTKDAVQPHLEKLNPILSQFAAIAGTMLEEYGEEE